MPSESDIGRVTWNFAKLVILMFQDKNLDRYGSTRLDS